MRVPVLNSGSSSIKYKLYDKGGAGVLAKGAIGNIGSCPSAAGSTGEHAKDRTEALALALAAIAAAHDDRIDAIGHRVVHGGSAYSAPALIACHSWA